MVDQERVCCLCGDVGFPDKLFRCSRCRFRFQHSYCSNYYCGSENSSSSSCSSTATTKQICDWCQSEGTSSSSTRHGSGGGASRREINNNLHIRSEYASGERIKQLQDNHNHNHNHNHQEDKAVASSTKNSSGVPSPRPAAHRRYKLLKDVMC